MAGALIREVLPQHMDLDGRRLVVVEPHAVHAQEDEAQDLSGVDLVLTTRELGHLWDGSGWTSRGSTRASRWMAPFSEATGPDACSPGSAA